MAATWESQGEADGEPCLPDISVSQSREVVILEEMEGDVDDKEGIEILQTISHSLNEKTLRIANFDQLEEFPLVEGIHDIEPYKYPITRVLDGKTVPTINVHPYIYDDEDDQMIPLSEYLKHFCLSLKGDAVKEALNSCSQWFTFLLGNSGHRKILEEKGVCKSNYHMPL